MTRTLHPLSASKRASDLRCDNRAAVLCSPRMIRVEDRPTPVPREHEVLVAITATGVCGSDIHYYRHGRLGNFVVQQPLVLGHESAGHVVGLGPGVISHRLGERVAVEPNRPCRRCDQCHSGRYNLCRDIAFLGTPPVDGSLARYIVVPSDFAVTLPDTVSDAVGALVEPLSVGLWACSKAMIEPGSRVLIAGAGPVGLCALIAARACGASEITVIEPAESRRERAWLMGATASVAPDDESARRGEVDAFIECSGDSRALAPGLFAVRPGGSAVIVGMGVDDTIPVPVAFLQTRELALTGTFRYANVFERAVGVASAYRHELEQLVDCTYPLEDAEKALTASERDPSVMKVIVAPFASPSGLT